MIPEVPGYLTMFESAVRPLVAAIALALVWTGAARMQAPTRSRYATAWALSVTLIAIPLPWLVAAQVYRIGGGLFLVLMVDGRLPWQFALPAGIGDVTTGAVAVVAATLLAQKANGARRAVYAWCLFGIADLVVAITMGAMTSPGRAHLLAFEAPNLLISAYPLVMVPIF